jgi:uncharacterized membrane protein
MRLLPLLILHISGGIVGLIAGTVAMAVRKGGQWHRIVGKVFAGGMFCLASAGAIMATMAVTHALT